MSTYNINITRRIRPATEPAGPYHVHHAKVECGDNLEHARAVLADLQMRCPEPEWKLELSETITRYRGVKGCKAAPA